jgi:mercuric ion transport protein
MNRIWKRSLPSIAGAAVAMLPKLACPACWPAYAGLLTSAGLGYLVSTSYLLPLTALFLAVALGAMAFRANVRHGRGPFLLGLIAATGIMLGKFSWGSDPVLYGAVGLLVVASLWNAWPRRDVPRKAPACPDCRRTPGIGWKGV